MAQISYFNEGGEIYLWLARYTGEKGDALLLSRGMKSAHDIDSCINRLIGQLERVRRQAKADLPGERRSLRRRRAAAP